MTPLGGWVNLAKPRPGEMSSEVGGPGLEGPYGKGTQAPKGPQSVCKNSNLPKKQHNVSQIWANFRNISGPSGT